MFRGVLGKGLANVIVNDKISGGVFFRRPLKQQGYVVLFVFLFFHSSNKGLIIKYKEAASKINGTVGPPGSPKGSLLSAIFDPTGSNKPISAIGRMINPKTMLTIFMIIKWAVASDL